MFHVSLLVKQRVVQLSVDDSIGLPVLEPASSRARDAGEEGGKNQVRSGLKHLHFPLNSPHRPLSA